MIRGRVLVIDGDEWNGNLLARVLQEKGYVVDTCIEARDGFRKACETTPDCIICNPELPDIDGAWVARKVRTEPGPISKVPFLFVGEVIDKTVRTQALGVGVDVFLARPPISNDEIAAQVDALIAMSRRHSRTEEDGSPSSMSMATAAIRGDLSAFPLASLLMMFEMERRSGMVQIVAESGKRASLTISSGLFAGTEVAGAQRPALEVLREVLSWRSGRFSFQPRESGSLPAPRASVGALVLEAMRLEDEENGPIQELDPDDLIEERGRASHTSPAPSAKVVVQPSQRPPPAVMESSMPRPSQPPRPRPSQAPPQPRPSQAPRPRTSQTTPPPPQVATTTAPEDGGGGRPQEKDTVAPPSRLGRDVPKAVPQG